MAQISLKGFTISYDSEESEVSVAGRVVQRFTTDARHVENPVTAQVKAQRWVKSQAAIEIDKAVLDDPATHDEFGNAIPIVAEAASDAPSDDEPTEVEHP